MSKKKAAARRAAHTATGRPSPAAVASAVNQRPVDAPERVVEFQEAHVFQEQTNYRLANLEAAVFGGAGKPAAESVDTTEQEQP